MNKIYLDVTSACQSGLNTGVKRMQRGLHEWLSRMTDYEPVYWQAALGNYRPLNSRDRQYLEQPFSRPARGLALYDAFAPGFLWDGLRAWRDLSQKLRWPQGLRPGDVLLVPDLLWDNRGSFFRRQFAPGVRSVAIFHDAIALHRPEQSRIDAHFCRLGVRALARFDRVICISREAEADLHFFWKKLGEKPVATDVVPWPVPFSQNRPENRPNFTARKLVCVARLEPHKNHLRLFEACEKLWREGLAFQLQLIGCKAYPGATRKILRSVRHLQDAGRDVSWKAHVTDEDLHAAYESSSFTVFPSLQEGFGLPIIESLWHGRPVVCGGNGALGEVSAGGGCEIVDVTRTEDLANGLRLLLTDRVHYERRWQEAATRPYRSWEQYWNHLSGIIGWAQS